MYSADPTRARSIKVDRPPRLLPLEIVTSAYCTKEPTISLLVGGGCDDRTEYVELRADGVGIAKATGTCSEDMRSIRYDGSSRMFR